MANYKASVVFAETDITTQINFSTIPVYADNAAAITGGLSAGNLYRTSSGDAKIVI
ncbi:MAG: hypothetical protein HRU18_16720 [Pseudoalteromonas sp.]|uniref:hypothetical protein n=1 Tax=Pseudoalteromonas sp. TaxID=53249 RepID=UPI001DED98D5|nr:hypothetical protein [Pseudoalteromonas sp.]NRA79850.1 hypothetical protein [Pseudoalteromonas sp.]